MKILLKNTFRISATAKIISVVSRKSSWFSKQNKRQSPQCPDTHRRSGQIQNHHGEIGVKRTRGVPKEIRHTRHQDADNRAEGNGFHQGVDCRVIQDKINEEGIG